MNQSISKSNIIFSRNENDYSPDEIVRVTIVVKENANKQQVIENLCEIMKNEASFELHNPKLSENVFTVNVKYSLIETIKTVDGVKDVAVSESVGFHDDSSYEENHVNEIVVQQDKGFFYEHKNEVIVLGAVIVIALVFLGKKALRK